ncbi:OsmC family protein [Myroides guanonis]|uniref:Putative redox protein n=1 Tax=Myroides guanonis TaxID=1150112 RepID=A0A1I3TCA0_9FLAO|nr:OsmC family protein [Myroides guanonis]SFJ68754.1 putative redox protein [Myroides guanonis]
MKTLNASIKNTPFKTEINTEDHVIYADEPVELGGENTAPSPFELLVASLASCTLITLKMYANRKEWEIKEIKLKIEYDEESKKIQRVIELIGANSEVNKERMLLIANKCPIHKLLESVLNIKTEII